MNEDILQELRKAVRVLERIESNLESIRTQLTLQDSSTDLSTISTAVAEIEGMLHEQAMNRALG